MIIATFPERGHGMVIQINVGKGLRAAIAAPAVFDLLYVVVHSVKCEAQGMALLERNVQLGTCAAGPQNNAPTLFPKAFKDVDHNPAGFTYIWVCTAKRNSSIVIYRNDGRKSMNVVLTCSDDSSFRPRRCWSYFPPLILV